MVGMAVHADESFACTMNGFGCLPPQATPFDPVAALADEFIRVDTDGFGHEEKLDHVESTLPLFVLGNERLRFAESSCGFHLGQRLPLTRGNQQIAKSVMLCCESESGHDGINNPIFG